MFDNRLVHVETISAEPVIKQFREIALYRKVFDELAKIVIIGNDARALITSALDHRRNQLSHNQKR
jgi:hypothetical protein